MTTPRCNHAESLWGRCTACGMTWDEQRSELQARLQALAQYNGTAPGARAIAEIRRQMDALQAEPPRGHEPRCRAAVFHGTRFEKDWPSDPERCDRCRWDRAHPEPTRLYAALYRTRSGWYQFGIVDGADADLMLTKSARPDRLAFRTLESR